MSAAPDYPGLTKRSCANIPHNVVQEQGTRDGGEEISLTVYLPKDTQKAVQALAAVAGPMPSPGGQPGGPPGYIADIEQKRARLAYGLEITKADGRKLRFGDPP